MKKVFGSWQLTGFAAVTVLGTLLHFLYDWTGSKGAALFSGVNESTWEHMKLLFFPMLLFALVQRFGEGKDYGNYWCLKLQSTLLTFHCQFSNALPAPYDMSATSQKVLPGFFKSRVSPPKRFGPQKVNAAAVTNVTPALDNSSVLFYNEEKQNGRLFMNLTEKQTASECIFDGTVVHLYKDIVELPDGKHSIREYVRHIGAVCVVPITEEGEVILERQYRYAVGQVLIEIPAGKLDYPGEDWESAARRELQEETGAVAAEMIDMGDYYGSPAIMGERIRMFLAKGLTFRDQHLDEDEFLETFRLPLTEAVDMVLRGEIPDGKTQAGILRAAAMHL